MDKPRDDIPVRTNPDLLTVEEAAALCRMSPSSMYDAVANRLIASVRLSGSGKRGKVLLHRADVLAWLEANRVEAGEGEDDGDLKYIR